MSWLPSRLPVVVCLVLAVTLAIPADGETLPPATPADGLTRDTFTDSTTAPHAPAPADAPVRTRTKRTRLDSKDFLSVHHTHHRRGSAKKRTQVAATPPLRRRNPVVGFVYWWNGWVLKTFHTKVGTVMLGSVGAKS